MITLCEPHTGDARLLLRKAFDVVKGFEIFIIGGISVSTSQKQLLDAINVTIVIGIRSNDVVLTGEDEWCCLAPITTLCVNVGAKLSCIRDIQITTCEGCMVKWGVAVEV